MRPHQRDHLPARAAGSTVLESFVQQVCSLTHADGAAIALSEAGELICRASIGNAPALGVTVGPESRFTRQCVQTAQLASCRDVEVDPRFQPMPPGGAHFRSAMAVPIVAEGAVVGVVEVFSSKAYAFDGEDAAILQRHAAVMALLLDKAEGPVPAAKASRVLPFPRPSRSPERWLRAVLKPLGF
jgi:putative methionine-R-sulfoxide reductase with GAF domain